MWDVIHNASSVIILVFGLLAFIVALASQRLVRIILRNFHKTLSAFNDALLHQNKRIDLLEQQLHKTGVNKATEEFWDYEG